MVPSDIVREKTGLPQHRLSYLVSLRLIPKPTRVGTSGCPGSAYAYPVVVQSRPGQAFFDHHPMLGSGKRHRDLSGGTAGCASFPL